MMTRKQIGEAWRQTKLERIRREARKLRRQLFVLKCSEKLITNMSERDATSLIRPAFYREITKQGFEGFIV